MRLAYYAGASTAAAAACLIKAFHQRPNFYSATVYLSQSNACVLILTNLLLVLAATTMYALQRLLYGPLRPIEIEQLSEKAWYAVLDTLLAMPSFREDVGGWLLAMFCLLLAGKVWGWIGEGRVDILEQQPPANPRLFHARLASSLVVSVLFDLWMLDYCVETVLADPRPGMMVIFTFEFAVLTVFSSFTLARYGLSLVQARIEKLQMKKAIDERKEEIRAERVTAAAGQNDTNEDGQAASIPSPDEPIEVDENEVDIPGWEEKRRYLFALEVLTDFIKLCLYIVFFSVSIAFSGLPMHIMRDVYMTFASFSKRVADYLAYRKATSDMNSRYPDATTEEIRGDSCIVCRETMVAWAGENQAEQPANPPRRRDEGLRAKKLPCGHILHLRCLKAWLERQQVCPTCRRPVVVQQSQPAAGGNANAGAQGQQGRQQPARRQGRARILNFGPVRIGFLNGPGDQIGNIVRQMQNQNQPQNQNQDQNQNQNNNAQPAGGQEGPNHLGLQVPYANTPMPSPPRSQVPTHVQLAQVEQRLRQEAASLQLEQQQLATLRAMEAELGRLRWLQQQQQQTQAGDVQPGTARSSGGEALRGDVRQRVRGGQEGLPEGMVLPEGWSVMPLRRAEGGAQTAAPQGEGTGNRGPPPPGDVPRNENGSPLFVENPAQSRRAQSNGETPSAQPSQGQPAEPTSTTAAPATAPISGSETVTPPTTTIQQPTPATNQPSEPSQPQPQNTDNQNQPPWNPSASESWSFVDPPAPPNGQPVQSSPPATSGLDEQQQRNGEGGSGKAKGPSVEDADDE